MALSEATGESASFYVYEDNIRSCLLRVEGRRGLRRHVRSGELLPLDKGSAGHVILAALDAAGRGYDEIRRTGYSVTLAERSAGAASISAAVYGAHRSVLGSVCVSGPVERLTQAQLEAFGTVITQTAAQLSWLLGGVSVTALRSSGRRRSAPARFPLFR